MNPRPITPGFYIVRLVKHGPWVPARILFDGFFYTVITNGKTEREKWSLDDLEGLWFEFAMGERPSPLLRIVLHGEPVSEAEYERRDKLRLDPTHPTANPTRPIDVRKLKLPF